MRCICTFSASSCFESSEIAGAHAGVFRPPKSDRVGVDTVTACKFFSRCSGIELAEDCDDLRFREATPA
jgi:hypothetical protein